MTTKLTNCRICGNDKLVSVVDLGEQALTGVFPKTKTELVPISSLSLVKCDGDNCCGLLQLDSTYALDKMYGDNYGYRSGLNDSMVKHLREKVKRIISMVILEIDDLVIDIGSNDSTTLKAYPKGYKLVGIDPTGIKFKEYYPEHIELIPEFFTKENTQKFLGNKKVKIVTSFSMFYDLPSPMQFMQDIYDVLDDNGIWVFEQSYMPIMLEKNSYDTICHEHLEYYSLEVIYYMTEKIGFSIIDIEFNDINGGSFSVTVAKKSSNIFKENKAIVQEILKMEREKGLNTLLPYFEFQKRIDKNKKELLEFLHSAKRKKKKVYALGASTKGNVILQYCNITKDLIFAIGEVNNEKFGSFTPGTIIPIIPEKDVLKANPDYILILPWHFRTFFDESDKFKLNSLVYPLPELEIV